MSLTAVSLFAGIGGFELAMERVGIRPVASVEIDQKASGVLSERFPNTQVFGDIKGVTSGDLLSAGFNPANGVITGGFPCQDLSVAGRRAGLAGERSGLFWEIHRLIDETKTKWFVLENVPGLLSSNNGQDMGIVLGSLAELGYGLAYRVLDAQHFGVAQRRRRVFIVGRLGDDWRTPAEILDIGEGRRGYHQKGLAKGQGTAAEVDGGLITGYGRTGFAEYAEGISTLTRTSHKRPEDNMVVEPYVKIVRSGERDADGNLPAEVWAERQTAPTLNLMDNTGESRATVIALQNTVIGRSDTAGPQGRGHSDEGGPMFTIDTTSPHGIVFHPHRTDGVRLQDKTINTLTAFMGTGGLNTPMVSTEVVRRITPVECERLQGFPDNWTAVSDGKPQSDSARYKQTGNAVAVPVVQWILGRIALSE
ncbi:Dcm Site-specific DNA methylase [uncultured Caudovirales phage]|uniref:DNA (cytosine-5-)-methyltransferase n=1 Tax=uncultured Caudovirales phage TaxID=2100421 RepID=A0A6J5SIC5_9CAUD|nr:Dcm Site-specific DNA methylase [uncultured Caudovirales phage]CAB4202656.1 Dcm Site-specific DNA methylase [uncultured Caudovirales phage]CAB4214021.1 Dcm Site-specific DNA methylase [uncultured Caudovirales phage]CAB5228642.1 Dcm Site-specific DNA methylase [uncultured Caudovirales phage]